MMSSVSPSLMNSRSALPVRFSTGRTAIMMRGGTAGLALDRVQYRNPTRIMATARTPPSRKAYRWLTAAPVTLEGFGAAEIGPGKLGGPEAESADSFRTAAT